MKYRSSTFLNSSSKKNSSCNKGYFSFSIRYCRKHRTSCYRTYRTFKRRDWK